MAQHTTRPFLPDAREMAFGVVVSEHHGELTGRLLEGVMHTLREAGCAEHNIQVKFVPEVVDLPMMTQFFAEYTDVDAVVVVGCKLEGDPLGEMLHPVLQNILQIQLQWNMPCSWCVISGKDRTTAYEQCGQGVEAAISAIRMVQHQIEMEAASPHAAADKRSLN